MARPSPNELTYEQAYERLEEIVNKLESGSLSLEESLRLFEEAAVLRKRCEELLNRAETAIKKITSDLDGRIVEEPLNLGEERPER